MHTSARAARVTAIAATSLVVSLVAVMSVWAMTTGSGRVGPADHVGGKTGDPSREDALTRPRLKRLGAGLYLTSGPSTTMPFINHVVLGVAWAALEPQDQDFRGSGWHEIHKVLANHPHLKVRLRIMAGRFAPAFVKQLGGPPLSGSDRDCSEEGGIAIVQPANGISSCVPYFWEDSVLRQYRQLMQEVARRLDGDPQVLDVVNSACMTNWAEPFIRSGSDVASNTRLWNAGLNETTDRHCLERSMEIHDRLFHRTRISLATHQQWQIIVDPTKDADGVAPSWNKERELLESFLATYGRKVILQNNGLGGEEGCAPSTPVNASLFCWMADRVQRKGFQLEGDRHLADSGTTVDDAVARALEMGACFVEHNQFGTDPTLAERYDDQLKDNCL